MLKKILVLSMLVCGGFSALATTDIQPNGNLSGEETAANCTQPVLGTYSGSTNFEAKWRANTVPLRWYSNNTLIENTESAANTCDYDGVLNIPAIAPNRIGYDFAGWRVRPTYDFSTIPTDTTNTNYTRWAKGEENGKDLCYIDTGTGGSVIDGPCNSEHSDLQQQEYKVTFPHGTVYGSAKCSSNAGTFGKTGTPDDVNGPYCWCMVTGYKPNGQNVIYAQSAAPRYVYDYKPSSTAATCNRICAAGCVNVLGGYQFNTFRQALFGITQSN